MPKSTFFTGQPIFNQLLSYIPRTKVDRLARKHNSDHYCKKFKAYDHLVTMLFCCFHHCTSLRELITGIQVNAHRLNHLGMVHTPRRSTLADANERRSADFFGDLYDELFKYHFGVLPDSLPKGKLSDKIFIVDSTTVTLFSEVFKACGNAKANGKKKGGVKAHVMIRAKDNVPCFVHITSASTNDKTVMPQLNLPKGSILVMDKGYNSYIPMAEWTKKGVTWVTRLNKRASCECVEERPVSDKMIANGIRSDKNILLGNPEKANKVPLLEARLITYYDEETDKEFQFITNNRELSALTIAGIYKRRWQIELLFRRIKQNFQLSNFLGDNQNAIKIQLLCTLIADLLVKVVKDKADKLKKNKWSFANVAGLIRQHLGTYIDIIKFLVNPEKAIVGYTSEAKNYQLSLFKT
ncbi:MAG: Transposase domain protein [Mucilaginibacter sp.]|nr:Transposase domain protein [Mucilaginibacter sp.]